VVVAAKDYLGVADYYCDGTADQTEIQAAIDYLASAFGGGMVELTEGQFNITAAIEMETNIILRGAGARTIIEKNCNDYAIEIVGGNGTEKENTKIWDLSVTRNTADTNTISLIYLSYADYANIDSLLLHDGYGGGIEIVYCDNLTISKTEIKDCRGSGVNISFCSSGIVVECRANNCHIYGIAITSDGDNFLVSNCISENNWQYGIMGCGKNISIENNIVRTNGATGIQVIPGQDLKGNNIIRGNIVENNGDNTNSAWSLSVANGMGIFIDNLFSEGNIVNSNYSKDNGNLIVNGACE
jgi:parallel beta-helix repeat protein